MKVVMDRWYTAHGTHYKYGTVKIKLPKNWVPNKGQIAANYGDISMKGRYMILPVKAGLSRSERVLQLKKAKLRRLKSAKIRKDNL